MAAQRAEKQRRRFERIVFPADEKVAGDFCMTGKNRTAGGFPARILNLSPGGIHLVLEKASGVRLYTGDLLLMKRIYGPQQLRFLSDIELEIVWELDAPIFRHIGYGCRYRALPDEERERIMRYVAAEAKARKNSGAGRHFLKEANSRRKKRTQTSLQPPGKRTQGICAAGPVFEGA
jgi:c-di-GMP-binding flagellar brake protein YcgR